MTTLELDTSGRVAGHHAGLSVWYEFDDLSPFMQGYVEALFAELQRLLDAQRYGIWARAAYHMLAPETLKRIMKIIAAHDARYPVAIRGSITAQRLAGQGLWRGTPLTPYLGDDGKVYLREA